MTSYVVVVALAIVPLLWVMRGALTASLEQTETEALLARAGVLQQRLAAAQRTEWSTVAHDAASLLGARVTVIDADGSVLADSELGDAQVAAAPNHRDRPEVAHALSTGQGAAVRHSASLNDELIYAAKRFEDPGGASAVVRLAARRSSVAGSVDAALLALRFGAAFAMTLALLFSLVAVFKVANPLRGMARTATEFAAGNWRSLEVPRTGDELEELGRAFEQLGNRVRAQLVSIGAHEAMVIHALEAMPYPLVVVDTGGVVVALNSSMRRALELHPQDEERLTRELVKMAPALGSGAAGAGLRVLGQELRAWALARNDNTNWWLITTAPKSAPSGDEAEHATQRLAAIETWFTDAAARPQFAAEVACLRKLFDDLESFIEVPPSLRVKSTPLIELLGHARLFACAGAGSSVDRVVFDDVPQALIAESMPGTARLLRELFGVGLRSADAGKPVPIRCELDVSHVTIEVKIRESMDLSRVERAARTGGAELAVVTESGEPSLKVRLLRA
jgi:HAMP domain-containing protein